MAERPPRLPITNPKHVDRLTVEESTGKLFWDDKEIVARKTIDFTGISQAWGWITACAIVLGGFGSAASGFASLNQVYCWVKVRSCKIVVLPQPPKGPECPVIPPIQDPPQPIVLSGIYFDTNSAILRLGSETALDNVIQFLKTNPSMRVEIQGHTDDTGTADHNVKLSRDRADSVKNWLTKPSHGIAADRLKSEGYGATKPVADNRTAEGREKNRRVEFLKLQP